MFFDVLVVGIMVGAIYTSEIYKLKTESWQ